MPIQGGTRFRKLQMGTQSSFASNTSASRILPWRGPIVVQPNRTLPDVDLGSLDPILASYNGPTNITQAVTGKAAFDDLPDFWGALLKGGVTPTALLHEAGALGVRIADPHGRIGPAGPRSNPDFTHAAGVEAEIEAGQ